MAIRYLSKVIGLSSVVFLAMTTQAEAGAATVGAILTNITNSWSSFPAVLSGASYLMGLIFATSGIFKFKDHVDEAGGQRSYSNTPLSAAVKRFLAGGMLFSGPYMASALQGNLLAGGGQVVGFTNVHAAPTGGGMDQMITQFVGNIAQPATYLVIAFAYISAIALMITGVVRLTKSEQEGARGPTGLGTILTFLSSGALFSFGQMIGAFSSSIFGTATANTYVNISPTILPAADAAQVAPVIEALMGFIMIVGFIAFLRGWFILKSFGDGNTQTSLAQALTFLVGGTLAVNLGDLVNALEATVGVNGITFQ